MNRPIEHYTNRIQREVTKLAGSRQIDDSQTDQSAAVRAYESTDPFRPEEVAAWVPPAPQRIVDTRANRTSVNHNFHVFGDVNGVTDATDYNAGLYVLRYQGARG